VEECGADDIKKIQIQMDGLWRSGISVNHETRACVQAQILKP
jgi:hypothetical protein